MRVILQQDVKNQGKKGDIIEVSDAYARNVLLRKKLAVEVNSASMNDLKLQKANEEKVAAENLAAARALAEKLEGKSVSAQVKTGEGGKMFGSISSKEIAAAISDQLGLDVDKRSILLNSPIKATGTTPVTVRLHSQVSVELKVQVEGA